MKQSIHPIPYTNKKFQNRITNHQIKDWILNLSAKGAQIVIVTSISEYRQNNITW